ncbi:MAG: DUF2163 domain-containing protein [Pseudomonadota bacterium]
MHEIDESLAAELAGGVTTLCRCWRIRRADGVELGFTDHDREIAFDGLVFEPESGVTRTEMERSLGLAVDNVEAAGALRSDSLTEADILAGRYDCAEISQWLADWREPERRLKVFEGRAGEIRRGELGFEMEVQGLAELLNRPVGRVYRRQCDAELGDARCGVALEGALVRTGEVAEALGARRLLLGGAAGAAEAGFFSLGRLEWTSGENAGASAVVRAHYRQGGAGGMVAELWNAPVATMQAGDAFRVVAGCDKTAETCREKFQNLSNFRGFPLMPGEDWAGAYPRGDEAHDGGSLFR